MGICHGPTYWNWSMSTTHPKETFTDQIFGQEEECQFLEKGILKKTCSACVCMTCQHFNYSSDKHCRTNLSCLVHRRLIPHGDHLISRCLLWMRQREKEIGWCPEVAWTLNRSFVISVLMPSLISIWGLLALLTSIVFVLVFGFSLTHLIWLYSQDPIIWRCHFNYIDRYMKI